MLSTAVAAGVGFGDHCAFIYTAEMAPPRYALLDLAMVDHPFVLPF